MPKKLSAELVYNPQNVRSAATMISNFDGKSVPNILRVHLTSVQTWIKDKSNNLETDINATAFRDGCIALFEIWPSEKGKFPPEFCDLFKC